MAKLTLRLWLRPQEAPPFMDLRLTIMHALVFSELVITAAPEHPRVSVSVTASASAQRLSPFKFPGTRIYTITIRLLQTWPCHVDQES